jgi:hypothetical protein
MKTVFCAAALALTLFGAPAFASDEAGPATTINVAQIKSGLHLRPEQEPYWPALEAAVRDVARHQGVHRIGHSVSLVLDSSAIHCIAAAARPLMATLDFGQLQAANGLANQMGLGAVVAALR